MLYGRQLSPTSSTSTVDQQEILLDDSSLVAIHQQQQLQLANQSAIVGSSSSGLPLIIATNNTLNNSSIDTTLTASTFSVAPPQTPSQLSQQRPPPQPPATNKRQSTAGAGHSSGRGAKRVANNKASPPKRPKLFHLPQQAAPWKSLQHHFLKHSDVKYRPEKRMTMAELGNEVLLRRNGWKVHHLVGQLTDLINNETQTRERVQTLLNIFVEDGAKKVHDLVNNCHRLPEQYATLLQSQRSYGRNEFKSEHIVTKIDDLLRGDLQRSNMFDDQMKDCRNLVVNITNEHRDRVARITTKFNKRIQL